ncbi:MAG: hypothetical protein H6591_06750 [Flavobacteriales bacterium]|nr:hypothetical protein [Flavobacteriales bacterium]
MRLVKDSVERATVFTNGKGEYEMYLERGYDYQVWFYRADLVPKYVRIDASEVPLFPDVPYYDMDADDDASRRSRDSTSASSMSRWRWPPTSTACATSIGTSTSPNDARPRSPR